MIVVDGVYSMEGDIADVPNLRRGSRTSTARHSRSTTRTRSACSARTATARRRTSASRDEVDLIVGTFSKSLASIGGFVAATESVIHYLRHHCRPLIFTAVAAALQHGRRARGARGPAAASRSAGSSLWANTRRLQAGFRQLGFDIGPTETPIVPVLIGPLEKTFIFWRKLFDAGVFTNPVAPPAVPPSQCRLRTSLMATHTADQIDFASRSSAASARSWGSSDARSIVPVRSARAGTSSRFIDLPYRLFARRSRLGAAAAPRRRA